MVDDPQVFLVYETVENEAAFKAHFETNRFKTIVEPELVPIASTHERVHCSARCQRSCISVIVSPHKKTWGEKMANWLQALARVPRNLGRLIKRAAASRLIGPSTTASILLLTVYVFWRMVDMPILAAILDGSPVDARVRFFDNYLSLLKFVDIGAIGAAILIPVSIGYRYLELEAQDSHLGRDTERGITVSGSGINITLNQAPKPDLGADITGPLSGAAEKRLTSSSDTTPPEARIEVALAAIGTRLNQETRDLGRRANVSLLIGITFAVVGLGILAGAVWWQEPPPLDEPWQKTTMRFVPKLSLVIGIEVFAYFFLRLYRLGLSELKYYQNEITNIEFWSVAYRQAAARGDKATVGKVTQQLLKIERNFILKKGEKTVSTPQDEPALDVSAIVAAVKAAVKEGGAAARTAKRSRKGKGPAKPAAANAAD